MWVTSKRILAVLFVTGYTALGANVHGAESYPARPVHIVVPGAPGSALDFVARAYSPALGTALKQPVVIENRPGASGIIGARQMISAAPDGYTLGMLSSDYAVNPSVQKDLPYDSVNDITPITIIGSTPLVLVVPGSSAFQNMSDLVAAARNEPGKLNYGTAGNGVIYLAGLMFNTEADIQATQIPFKGGNPLITALVSQQIDYAFLAIPSILGQVKDGSLRALAITANERSDLLPDVPTLDEAGLDGFELTPWIALAGPAGLPVEQRDFLREQLADAVRQPEVQRLFSSQGFVTSASSPEEAMEIIKHDIQANAELFEKANRAR